MTSVVVVGDGAVGTAVAVAMCGPGTAVTLAGPCGTHRSRQVFSTDGYLHQTSELLHTSIDSAAEADLVVAALKAYSIKSAVSDIKRIARGRIVCLSNGKGLTDEWGELAGRVEYGVLSMGFRKTGPTSVKTTEGAVFLEAGSPVGAVFSRSAIPLEEVPDIQQMRWAKWFANSIINPVGALTGLENNRIAKAGLGPLIRRLASELSQLMPSSEALTQGKTLLDWLLTHSSNRCSMLQDVEQGIPTEISYLTGFCENRLSGRCPTVSALVSLIRAKTLNSDHSA